LRNSGFEEGFLATEDTADHSTALIGGLFMNAVADYKRSNVSNARCSDSMTMAERELSAFFNAVAQSFGSEQAKLSAQDWLRELIEIDGLPTSAREWRLITSKASTRLARRVRALSLLTLTDAQIAS
jgi:hypothetical protein